MSISLALSKRFKASISRLYLNPHCFPAYNHVIAFLLNLLPNIYSCTIIKLARGNTQGYALERNDTATLDVYLWSCMPVNLFIIITVSTSQAKTLHGGVMQLQLINLILKLFNRGNFLDVIR